MLTLCAAYISIQIGIFSPEFFVVLREILGGIGSWRQTTVGNILLNNLPLSCTLSSKSCVRKNLPDVVRIIPSLNFYGVNLVAHQIPTLRILPPVPRFEMKFIDHLRFVHFPLQTPSSFDCYEPIKVQRLYRNYYSSSRLFTLVELLKVGANRSRI